MGSLIVLLLSLAFSAHTQPPADEAFQTIQACGTPLAVWGSGGVHELRYKQGVLHFVSNGHPPPDEGYIFRGASLGTSIARSLPAAAKLIPCLGQVNRSEDFAAKYTPAALPPAPESKVAALRNSNSSYILMLLTLCAVVLMVAAKGRAWQDRPRRLCVACGMIAQPQQHSNKRLYCGNCGADSPVLLDSPIAVAYLARTPDSARDPLTMLDE